MRARTISVIRFIFLLGILLFANIAFPARAGSVDHSVILVMDASGSMDGKSENGSGRTKIEDAREAAVAGLVGLDERTEVALIVFYDCSIIILETPFTTDLDLVRSEISKIAPQGRTPLADSIEMAVDYMKTNASGTDGMIILLTDGGESCNGDAVTAADHVKEVRINCRFYVVDYGSGSEEELKRIAEAGGGSYYSPKDKEELSDHMEKATNPIHWPDLDLELKKPDNIGEDIREASAIVFAIILLIIIIFAAATFLVIVVNLVFNLIKPLKKTKGLWLLSFLKWFGNGFSGWRLRRREKRRRAREMRRAQRETRAAERRRAREIRRAERERLARERRRMSEMGVEKEKAGICPFQPMMNEVSRRREERRLIEQRIAEERRRAEMERLAEERRRAEKKRLAEERRRKEEERRAAERRSAEMERMVAANRKRKKLFMEVAELIRNELNILPPTDLEEKIKADPYAAETDVGMYREKIETERKRRTEEMEKRREEERKSRKKGEEGTGEEVGTRGENECPACSKSIRYVPSFKRWYCDTCRKYLPKSFKNDGNN